MVSTQVSFSNLTPVAGCYSVPLVNGRAVISLSSTHKAVTFPPDVTQSEGHIQVESLLFVLQCYISLFPSLILLLGSLLYLFSKCKFLWLGGMVFVRNSLASVHGCPFSGMLMETCVSMHTTTASFVQGS